MTKELTNSAHVISGQANLLEKLGLEDMNGGKMNAKNNVAETFITDDNHLVNLCDMATLHFAEMDGTQKRGKEHKKNIKLTLKED